jgi:hypothetical protein
MAKKEKRRRKKQTQPPSEITMEKREKKKQTKFLVTDGSDQLIAAAQVCSGPEIFFWSCLFVSIQHVILLLLDSFFYFFGLFPPIQQLSNRSFISFSTLTFST